MRPHPLRTFVFAALALVALGGRARAGIDFSYSTDIVPPLGNGTMYIPGDTNVFFDLDNGTSFNFDNVFEIDSVNGSVKNPNSNSATLDIVHVLSNPNDPSAFSGTTKGGTSDYTLTVTITDTKSGGTGQVRVGGSTNGAMAPVSSGPSVDHVLSTFDSSYLDPLTNKKSGSIDVTIGDNIYTLTFGPGFASGVQDVPTNFFASDPVGGLSPQITVRPVNVPEPASVLLTGMGALGLWGLFRRRARA
jgi:hypothetical protein